MATANPVCTRKDTILNNDAEEALSPLCKNTSSASEYLNRAELDTLLEHGIQSIRNGKMLSEAEVDAELEKEFNI